MASGTSDSHQAISVRLVGDNYTHWAFVMKKFIMGKSMWKYISGDAKKPTDTLALSGIMFHLGY